jgi:hypothetical protein
MDGWMDRWLVGWMDGGFECCLLSGSGLCDELITRSEDSNRLWRVVVCDQETSHLIAGIAGSNPAGDMEIRLLCVV